MDTILSMGGGRALLEIDTNGTVLAQGSRPARESGLLTRGSRTLDRVTELGIDLGTLSRLDAMAQNESEGIIQGHALAGLDQPQIERRDRETAAVE